MVELMKTMLKILLPATLLSASVISAVTLPPPDKDGWIHLFTGSNAADWYYAYNGTASPTPPSKSNFPSGAFTVVKGDTIQAAGNPKGQVYYNQSFSYYRISYEMHFPGSQGNCGMLIHVQVNDPTTSGFPRAIESQGDPGQGMGEIWPIGDVWVTVRAAKKTGDTHMRYYPDASEIVYGGANWSSRVVAGKDGWGNPSYTTLAAKTGWVKQDVEAHGSDSVLDFVQDTLRIKYRLPHVSHPDSKGNHTTIEKYLKDGFIGWQSEGTQVWYRNIKIKLLPGDPLYTPTYTAWNLERTIRPKNQTRVLILDEGTMGFLSNDSRYSHIYSPAGRVLPNLRISVPSVSP